MNQMAGKQGLLVQILSAQEQARLVPNPREAAVSSPDDGWAIGEKRRRI